MEKTDGTVDRIYVWGSDILGMMMPTSGGYELYGYFQNAHGDVTGLYQGDYCYAEYDYDAYGNVVSCSETGISNPIRYAGYYYDTDTQNYYLMNRYYSPYQGRFLTLDPYWNVSNMLYGKFTGTVQKRVYYPAVVQSGNRFAYCLNNPICWYDPWGLDSYIIYSPEWEEDAESIKKSFMEEYGYSSEEIHLIKVRDAEEFEFAWNNMGIDSIGNAIPIDYVVIDTHADPETLLINDSEWKVDNVDLLNNKKIEALIIDGCNAGHLDYKDTNLAARFSKKVEGAPVIASDGTVWSSKNNDGELTYTSKGDDIFHKLQNKISAANRESRGWLTYIDGQPIIENRTSVIEVRDYGSMVFYAKTGYLPDDEEVINTGGGIFKVGRNALSNMLKRVNSK